MSNFLLWWEQLKADFITCFITKDRWRYIVRGLGNTLKIALVAVLLGIVVGSVVAIVRSAHDKNIHEMRPGPGRTLLRRQHRAEGGRGGPALLCPGAGAPHPLLLC